MKRNLFTVKDITHHFKRENLDGLWSSLVNRRPRYLKLLWSSLSTKECKAKQSEHNWTLDETFLKLRNSLLTFNWVMGARVTEELLFTAQTPMLIALMDVEGPTLNPENQSEYMDLQCIYLLAVLRGISRAQTYMEPENMLVDLINELNLDSDLVEALTGLAVKANLLTLEEFTYG